MKRIACFIVLSLTLLSCSKPAEPELDLPGVGNKAKSQGFTIDNEVKINYEANVTVVDADTGLSIEGARVRGRIDAPDTGPKFVEGIELGDGEYYLSTNDLIGSYYVGASADGYPGNASYTPSFPYEIKLKSGETVTVSGEIIDEFHRPVTRGIMNLRVDNDWGKNWPKFYLCSTKINQHGKFRLENIPANVKDVYAKYELGKERIADLRDQSFNIEYEDIYLRLQLPPKPVIKGTVIYSSGEAVSGAWVWVEQVAGKDLDVWNKLVTDKERAWDKVKFLTNEDGEFELEFKHIPNKYLVKAYHPFYVATYKGPYSITKPHPEELELVIKNEGARLVGKISNQAGAVVENVSASYDVEKGSAFVSESRPNNLVLNIEENGDYISGIIPGGVTRVEFKAPGYVDKKIRVNIVEDKITFLDVKFRSDSEENLKGVGTVYDAATQQPIAGVKVEFSKLELESQITDSKGQFHFEGRKNHFEFSAPGYASIPASFRGRYPHDYATPEAAEKAYQPKFYMSHGGNVRLYVKDQNGQPLNGCSVDAASQNNNSPYNVLKLVDGEVLFTNLSSHLSPFIFNISDSKFREILLVIDDVEVVPGELVEVYTNLPSTGKLILEFKNPFKKEDLVIRVSPVSGKGQSFSQRDVNQKDQSLIIDDIPVNDYSLVVGTSYDQILTTNINIVAGNTTVIEVDNEKQELGVIEGIVKTADGSHIPWGIYVKAKEPGNIIKFAIYSHDNNFKIGKLSKKYLYDLYFGTKDNTMNIVIKDLKPDGPQVEIVLPQAYSLTGNMIDSTGNQLKGTIRVINDNQRIMNPTMLSRERFEGEFRLYPVFIGTHKIKINVRDYVSIVREFTINDSDLDLGDIVLTDRGVMISGRILDENNLPKKDVMLSVIVDSKPYGRVGSKSDGRFKIKRIASGKTIKITSDSFERDLGVVSSDLDLGDIVIKESK